MAGNKEANSEPNILSEDQETKIKAAINRLAKTDDGITLFRYIKWVCMYDDSTLYLSPDGKMEVNSMVYNEALKFIYRNIRGVFDKESLINVELEQLK